METAFKDGHGILFKDYHKTRRNNNKEYYTALFDYLKAEIKKQRSHLKNKIVLFHHDNAQSEQSPWSRFTSWGSK